MDLKDFVSGQIQKSTPSNRQYAEPIQGHVSLGQALRFVIWVIPALILGVLFYMMFQGKVFWIPATVISAFLIMIVVSGIRVAAQWERGVVLRLGKFQDVKGPGILYIIPIIDYVYFIDTRTLALNIPRQKVITRDNVPAEIDSVLFFMVMDPEKAITKIQDFRFAVAQYAQAALRDVVGGLSLDDLLTEREHIQKQIGIIVEERIKEWGMHVDSIRLQDIDLPEDLKKMMSRQASAEREKRATITKAEGDKMAAVNLAEAARIMATSPGAMQLRSLQTIDGLGPSSSNTVVLYPTQIMEMTAAMLSKGTIGKDITPPPQS